MKNGPLVVFLDDNKNRTEAFRSSVPFANLHTTAETIIQELAEHLAANEIIDQLFLDHDLGGEVYVDSSRPDTGMEVVRWIVKNKPEILEIVVHTCNSVASKIMEEDLKNAGYKVIRMPWTMLIKSL